MEVLSPAVAAPGCRFDGPIVAFWLDAMGAGSFLTSGAAATALGWSSKYPLHLPWLCIDSYVPLARDYRAHEAKIRGLKKQEKAKLQILAEHFSVPSHGQAHR
jgi:hypothetical protein